MKKHFKRFLPVVLTIIMVMLSAVGVQAQTIFRPDQVLTLYSANSKIYDPWKKAYDIANETPFNTDILMDQGVTGYKTSNISVVSLIPRKVQHKTAAALGTYTIRYMRAKKTGTVTLSYKVNNNTYKQKTTVRKYVNPLSTLKIGSLSLASKFKKDSTYTLSYEKYKNKELKLQIKTKGRWELSGVRYITSPKTSNSMGTWIPDGGTFKVTQKNCSLTAYVFDPKTKQSEECLIIFKQQMADG